MIDVKNTIEEVHELLSQTITPELAGVVSSLGGQLELILDNYKKVIAAHNTAQTLLSNVKDIALKGVANLETTKTNLTNENESIRNEKQVIIKNCDTVIEEKNKTITNLDKTISDLSTIINSKNKENDGLTHERTQLTMDIADLQGQAQSNRRITADTKKETDDILSKKDIASKELGNLNLDIENATLKLNKINLEIAGNK